MGPVQLKEIVRLGKLSKKKLRKMNFRFSGRYQRELSRYQLIYQIVFWRPVPDIK